MVTFLSDNEKEKIDNMCPVAQKTKIGTHLQGIEKLQLEVAIITATSTTINYSGTNNAVKITTPSLTTAAGAYETFTINSGMIGGNTPVFVSIANGTNTVPGVTLNTVTPSQGSLSVTIKNTGSQALNGTLILYMLIVL